MLTQSGAPGHVIGWTNFSHYHSIHGFCKELHKLNRLINLEVKMHSLPGGLTNLIFDIFHYSC